MPVVTSYSQKPWGGFFLPSTVARFPFHAKTSFLARFWGCKNERKLLLAAVGVPLVALEVLLASLGRSWGGLGRPLGARSALKV